MQKLIPAAAYTPCKELWCITTYFNPARYRTKRVNYERFAAPVRKAGISLLTVECAFGDDPFDLSPAADVIQVRAPDILWQKERLLNLGMSRLPAEAAKVAWLDADILFSNPDWAVQTAALLERAPVVQPFSDRKKLLADGLHFDEKLGSLLSFAHVFEHNPECLLQNSYFAHGSTGFAWAARRSILDKHGLYDAMISGIGDFMMAHALAGNFSSLSYVKNFSDPLIDKAFQFSSPLRRLSRKLLPRSFKKKVHTLPLLQPSNRKLRDHFEAWGKGIFQDVQGKMAAAPGTVIHLWHGDNADRCYRERNLELIRLGFDPLEDIQIDASGAWRWASNKAELQDWARNYFRERREDGR